MKKIHIGILIITIVVPVAVGMISAFLSYKGMAIYATMSKPPLSPPAWVFSVAWTVLYIVMGVASYFVVVSDADSMLKVTAMLLYGVQLVMNFFWSLIFFNWNNYILAFVWLMFMWCLVIVCAWRFYAVKPIAGYLMIPYILWLTFAAYLNLGAYILSGASK